MTAIAGCWMPDGGSAAACAGLLEAHSAWGPHHRARHDEPGLSLGRNLFRRLPEDRFDTGVVEGAGGRLHLVADVRLDQREELARTLGRDPRSGSDADLTMAAFEKWGEEAIDRLHGDFALALWDRERRRLILARDALGQRPLHHVRTKAGIAFASMPAPLAELAGTGVDPAAVADFLALLWEGERSPFSGVRRVPPGGIVTVTSDGESSRRFWSPSLDPVERRPEEHAEALREALDRATQARLRGAEDVVATHLSGGLDSSAVTATAARLLGGAVFAYTSAPREGYDLPSFGDSFADETAHATAVAALYPNLIHLVVRTGTRSPLDHLHDEFRFLQQPMLNVANRVWGEAIHADAQVRKVGVLLSGQVGNLSLTNDGLHALSEMVAGGRFLRLMSMARSLHSGGSRWGSLAMRALGPFLPSSARRWVRRSRGTPADISRSTLLREEAILSHGLIERVEALGQGPAARPQREGAEARFLALRDSEFGNYNGGTLARWGIDVRDPTADRALIELSLRIPSVAWLHRGRARGLARLALSDRLPPEVTEEARKGQQSADWHEGFSAARASIAEEVEKIAACPAAAAILDVERMRGMVAAWPPAQPASQAAYHAYRQALLRAIAAGHFIRLGDAARKTPRTG